MVELRACDHELRRNRQCLAAKFTAYIQNVLNMYINKSMIVVAYLKHTMRNINQGFEIIVQLPV